MANIKAVLSNIKIGDDFVATLHFTAADGLTTDVTVHLPSGDRPLSKIGEEAIAKARGFLRRVTEA